MATTYQENQDYWQSYENMSEEVSVQDQQQPQFEETSNESSISASFTNTASSTDANTISSESNDASTAEEAEQIRLRMEEMEKEAAKLRELHSQLSNANNESDQEKKDIDSRSVYIGNVDYGTTPLELQQHFSSAGVVNRVTILMNKFTGQPKGFAYLEYADIDGVNKAVATLDGSLFRERELKVNAKRTNLPGLSSSNRGAFRGGRGRGGFRGRGGIRGGRGRGGFRGASRFTPY